MSTVSVESGVELLKNDGYYPGDPQCGSIWGYWSGFHPHPFQIAIYYNDYVLLPSGYVYNPTLLWCASSGITEEGRKVLKRVSQNQQIVPEP